MRPLSPNRSLSRAIEPEIRWIVSDRLHLGEGIAARREVELVGLVRQLRDTFEIDGLERFNLGGHLEGVEIFAVVGKSFFERGSLGIMRVEGSAFQVFLREADRLQ